VRQTLRNYDVFVLCSKIEGVSIALLEAAESGIAILYSSGLANVQVLDDFNVGFCVGEGSAENIVRGLDLFVESISSLDKFAENSRTMCREMYSEKVISEKLGYEFDAFFTD
jgi:glycosyltransferase involved in cell wall biosynthesis